MSPYRAKKEKTTSVPLESRTSPWRCSWGTRFLPANDQNDVTKASGSWWNACGRWQMLRCAVFIFQLVCVHCTQLSWGSWWACPQTHQSNEHGLHMLLYRTLAYAQQIPSDKYRKSGEVAPPPPCLFFATRRSVLTQRFHFEQQYWQTSVLAADNYNCLGV